MIGEITWAIPIGILLFLEATFLILYLFEKYKKVSYVLYTLGLNLYVFSIFYTWNTYENNKNLILIMLVLSSLILFVLGKLIFKPKTKNLEKKKSKNKILNYSIIILSILFLIIFIVGIFSTSTYKINFKDNITVAKIITKIDYNLPRDKSIVIGNITINNNEFLPTSALVKPFFGCYNNQRIPLIIDNKYISLNKNFIINIYPKTSLFYNITIPNYILSMNSGSNNTQNKNDTYLFIYRVKNNLQKDIYTCNFKNKVLIKKIKINKVSNN